MNLLLVEDDRVIAAGLVYSLTQEGYNVTHCSTFAAASDAIKKQSFALCLFDVSLPDGDGFSLCKQVKQKSDTPGHFSHRTRRRRKCRYGA